MRDERRVEVDGTLWFVTHCGGCPLRKDRKNALSVCTRLNKVIRVRDDIMDGCPLARR